MSGGLMRGGLMSSALTERRPPRFRMPRSVVTRPVGRPLRANLSSHRPRRVVQARGGRRLKGSTTWSTTRAARRVCGRARRRAHSKLGLLGDGPSRATRARDARTAHIAKPGIV